MPYIISLIVDILTWLVILHVLLSYFLAPYHPIRQAIDRVVEPMLWPIRRYVPPMGALDFSPFVLIILLQLIGRLIAGLLASL